MRISPFIVAAFIVWVTIGTTSMPAAAGTCKIAGQYLVAALGKAQGNGYYFQCKFKNLTTKGPTFYARPGKLGCKGTSLQAGRVELFAFRGKPLNGGWKVSGVTASGKATVEKFIASDKIRITRYMAGPTTWDLGISQMNLKHNSNSRRCSNNNHVQIMEVLTEAFGN